MADEQPKPDPNNPDAHAGPAGEGYSDGGSDAWYHEALLEGDEEQALEFSRKKGWGKQ